MWFRLGTLKFRGISRGGENIDAPQHKEEENDIHILLKCKETWKWREQFFNNKWLHINEEMALKKTIIFAKSTELKIFFGKFLCKINVNGKTKEKKNCANFSG